MTTSTKARGRDRDGRTATDAFLAHVAAIRSLLAEIEEAAENHFDVDSENVTWGNVGDVAETHRVLRAELGRIQGDPDAE